MTVSSSKALRVLVFRQTHSDLSLPFYLYTVSVQYMCLCVCACVCLFVLCVYSDVVGRRGVCENVLCGTTSTHTHAHAQTHAHTPRACMCVYVVVCVHMCVCAFMNFVQPTTALYLGVDMLSDPLRCTVQLKLLLRSVLVCVNIHVHEIAS